MVEYERLRAASSEDVESREPEWANGRPPGRRTLTEAVVQLKAARAAAPPSSAEEDPTAAPAYGGVPLPGAVRARMERGFGVDFSDVRVHVGERADLIGATAYARGDELHFAPGAYDPESAAGQALLGHELAHVVQQREGRVSAPQGKGAPIAPDPALEAEADLLGARVAAGELVARGGGGAAASGPAVVQRNQRVGANLPTAAQQLTIEAHLDPNAAGPGGVPDVTPYDGDDGAMATAFFTALTNYLVARGAQINAMKVAPKVAMGATGVGGIVTAIKALIDAEYAAWVNASVRTPAQLLALAAPVNVIDATDEAQRLALMGKTGNKYEVAMDTACWIVENDAGVGTAKRNHHYQRLRTPTEGQLFINLIHNYVTHGTNQQALVDLTLYCMNQEGAGGIALNLTTDPHTHGGDADRIQRWHIFGKACHEIMHSLAHPAFMLAVRNRTVMKEGFTEYFASLVTTAAINQVRLAANEALRHAVEGVVSPINLAAIPVYAIPGDYATAVGEVQNLRGVVGEHALRAAYFQGHVELLGLAGDGTRGALVAPPHGPAPVRVPAGVTTIAALAVAANVPALTITGANLGLADPLVPGTPVVVPGCREHVVIAATDVHGTAPESRAQIATQNGVSEVQLRQANPGIAYAAGTTWVPLAAGDRILIPA